MYNWNIEWSATIIVLAVEKMDMRKEAFDWLQIFINKGLKHQKTVGKGLSLVCTLKTKAKVAI
jgi:hypothetical protein